MFLVRDRGALASLYMGCAPLHPEVHLRGRVGLAVMLALLLSVRSNATSFPAFGSRAQALRPGACLPAGKQAASDGPADSPSTLLIPMIVFFFMVSGGARRCTARGWGASDRRHLRDGRGAPGDHGRRDHAAPNFTASQDPFGWDFYYAADQRHCWSTVPKTHRSRRGPYRASCSFFRLALPFV